MGQVPRVSNQLVSCHSFGTIRVVVINPSISELEIVDSRLVLGRGGTEGGGFILLTRIDSCSLTRINSRIGL